MCSYWPTEEGPGDPDRVATLLRSCYRPEDLLYPQKGTRPEDALPQVGEIAPTDIRALGIFCRYVRRWIRTTLLPVDQMLMAVAQDLMRNADMARTALEQALEEQESDLRRRVEASTRERERAEGCHHGGHLCV